MCPHILKEFFKCKCQLKNIVCPTKKEYIICVRKSTNSWNNKLSTSSSSIKEFSKDVSCLNTLVSGSSINVLNNNGNLSLIGVECGFNNLGNVSSDATHGDSVSFEYLVKQDPEYIFVLDRNSVTGDTNIAKDVVENEVVKQTNAYKNNKIIYLEHSNVWYTASGGITALGVMLDDLELGLGLNK